MSKHEELEWLKSRQTGVGSSDSPVLALDKEKVFGKTILDLYLDKKKILTLDDVENSSDNPSFRRGHTYEPLAIALFEQQYGIKVFAPRNDEERYKLFRLQDDEYEWLFTDLDGLCEDGWVLEAKSPMQRIADKIKSEGVKEYFQIQAQHHVRVASNSELPFLGRLPDGCPGTRLIVFEPEMVQVQMYELPREEDMISTIVDNARNFWLSYVVPGVPPINVTTPIQIKTKAKGGKYVEVAGDAWNLAYKEFVLSIELYNAAQRRKERAAENIQAAMKAAGHESIIVNNHKFLYKQQAGRKSLNKKLLAQENPGVDLSRYEIQGDPYWSFRTYGPKDQRTESGESLDGQLLTLRDEFEHFATSSMDPELAMAAFDELRDRAELYARMLDGEVAEIKEGIDIAYAALAKNIKEKPDEDGADDE